MEYPSLISDEEVIEPKTILMTENKLPPKGNIKKQIMQTGNLNENGRFMVPRKEGRN